LISARYRIPDWGGRGQRLQWLIAVATVAGERAIIGGSTNVRLDMGSGIADDSFVASSAGHRRDYSFFQWAVIGFLIAFGVITGFSIGLPFLAVGIVALSVLWTRERRWPGTLGSISGIGAVGVVIGIIGEVADPSAWVAIGACLTMSGAVGFWSLRCRPGLPV